jgi:hypothetical protein
MSRYMFFEPTEIEQLTREERRRVLLAAQARAGVGGRAYWAGCMHGIAAGLYLASLAIFILLLFTNRGLLSSSPLWWVYWALLVSSVILNYIVAFRNHWAMRRAIREILAEEAIEVTDQLTLRRLESFRAAHP